VGPVDEVDIALCRNLLRNSRTPYSDLGKELGLTPQAVHRRVRSLTEAGIVKGTTAYPSFRAVGRMWVLIHGWSKAPSMAEVAERLRENQSVAVFQIASGNYIYIQGSVRDANDLAQFVSYSQKAASLHDAQVGIMPTPSTAGEGALTYLDLRLIAALREDARRPIAEVAEEVGVSAKTARKRLDRMEQEELVQFSIHWQPDSQGDTITNIHLTLREGVEGEKVAFLLIKKMAANVVRTYTFSNLPNQLIVLFWTRNIKEMERTCRELEGEGIFHSVVPNILRNMYYYDEHRDRILDLLLKKAQVKARPRTSGQ
jgi:DNA-binding Lrp family transcriptional regulator